jgi:hypothetical protein
VLFSFLVIVPIYSSAEDRPNIYIGLSEIAQPIVVGQPIVVVLELKSSVRMSIDLGANSTANLEFTVTHPSGSKSALRIPRPDFTAPGNIAIVPDVPYR